MAERITISESISKEEIASTWEKYGLKIAQQFGFEDYKDLNKKLNKLNGDEELSDKQTENIKAFWLHFIMDNSEVRAMLERGMTRNEKLGLIRSKIFVPAKGEKMNVLEFTGIREDFFFPGETVAATAAKPETGQVEAVEAPAAEKSAETDLEVAVISIRTTAQPVWRVEVDPTLQAAEIVPKPSLAVEKLGTEITSEEQKEVFGLIYQIKAKIADVNENISLFELGDSNILNLTKDINTSVVSLLNTVNNFNKANPIPTEFKEGLDSLHKSVESVSTVIKKLVNLNPDPESLNTALDIVNKNFLPKLQQGFRALEKQIALYFSLRELEDFGDEIVIDLEEEKNTFLLPLTENERKVALYLDGNAFKLHTRDYLKYNEEGKKILMNNFEFLIEIVKEYKKNGSHQEALSDIQEKHYNFGSTLIEMIDHLSVIAKGTSDAGNYIKGDWGYELLRCRYELATDKTLQLQDIKQLKGQNQQEEQNKDSPRQITSEQYPNPNSDQGENLKAESVDSQTPTARPPSVYSYAREEIAHHANQAKPPPEPKRNTVYSISNPGIKEHVGAEPNPVSDSRPSIAPPNILNLSLNREQDLIKILKINANDGFYEVYEKYKQQAAIYDPEKNSHRGAKPYFDLLQKALRGWFDLKTKSYQYSHYDILGVTKTSSIEDIERSCRKKLRTYHPDANKDYASEEVSKCISVAKTVLLNPIQKMKYDSELRLNSRSPQPNRQSYYQSGQEASQSYHNRHTTTSTYSQPNPNSIDLNQIRENEKERFKPRAKEFIEYLLTNKGRIDDTWKGMQDIPKLINNLIIRSTNPNYEINAFTEVVFEMICSNPRLEEKFLAFSREWGRQRQTPERNMFRDRFGR